MLCLWDCSMPFSLQCPLFQLEVLVFFPLSQFLQTTYTDKIFGGSTYVLVLDNLYFKCLGNTESSMIKL